jgi:hypothetical protein
MAREKGPGVKGIRIKLRKETHGKLVIYNEK